MIEFDEAKERARAEEELPQGILDSAELFQLAIKEGTGGHEYREGALEYLKATFEATMRLIDSQWEENAKRYGMAYWTGAFLGLRVANRAYVLKLQQLQQDGKEGKKPLIVV